MPRADSEDRNPFRKSAVHSISRAYFSRPISACTHSLVFIRRKPIISLHKVAPAAVA